MNNTFDALVPEWHRKQVGNELMAFQSRDFATQLIGLVKVLFKESRARFSAEKHENRKKIEALVLDYTGLIVSKGRGQNNYDLLRADVFTSLSLVARREAFPLFS